MFLFSTTDNQAIVRLLHLYLQESQINSFMPQQLLLTFWEYRDTLQQLDFVFFFLFFFLHRAHSRCQWYTIPLKKCAFWGILPHRFPSRRSRCICWGFRWKAGLAAMGPCTGWRSSEPSLDTPSPAYRHGSTHATSVVSNDSCCGNRFNVSVQWSHQPYCLE